MIALKEAWLSFKGKRNTDFAGLRILEMPRRPRARANGVAHEIPGRSGDVWQPDGSYRTISVTVRMLADGEFDIDDICGWLTGSGDLIFSDEPNRAYKARAELPFTRSSFVTTMTAQAFSVEFTCQPYRYAYPRGEDIIVISSGTKIENPGTAKSDPRITIIGSGTFALTIGTQIIQFENVPEGGIIIDTEFGDAFTPDMAGFLNSCVDGELPSIPVGASYVSWEVESGGVDSVIIEPRWRYI